MSSALGGARLFASGDPLVMAEPAVSLAEVSWLVLSRLLPTTPIMATAAAAPAIAKRSRPGRRRLVLSSGVTEALKGRAARWACSAARLALIRATRVAGMGSGAGSPDRMARTPVRSSSSGDVSPRWWGVVRVLTSMLL